MFPPMIEKEIFGFTSPVIDKDSSDVFLILWLVITFAVSGLFSMLRWFNSPMPVRTWGQAILAYLNGVAVALLTALFVGDKVLAHEITILQFTFLVLVMAIGGSQVFDFITKTLLKLVYKAASTSAQIDKNNGQ